MPSINWPKYITYISPRFLSFLPISYPISMGSWLANNCTYDGNWRKTATKSFGAQLPNPCYNQKIKGIESFENIRDGSLTVYGWGRTITLCFSPQPSFPSDGKLLQHGRFVGNELVCGFLLPSLLLAVLAPREYSDFWKFPSCVCLSVELGLGWVIYKLIRSMAMTYQ